jgi:FtsH-binding integral membrane protein
MPAVFGLVAASVINIFIGFEFLSFAISVVALLVFTVLTAMDMQQAKYSYYELDNQEAADKQSVIFALSMYINLVNIFVSLLQLFGQQKNQ